MLVQAWPGLAASYMVYIEVATSLQVLDGGKEHAYCWFYCILVTLGMHVSVYLGRVHFVGMGLHLPPVLSMHVAAGLRVRIGGSPHTSHCHFQVTQTTASFRVHIGYCWLAHCIAFEEHVHYNE